MTGRKHYPGPPADLLALIPDDWRTDAVTEAAEHLNATGCMGCRAVLWDTIDTIDRETGREQV